MKRIALLTAGILLMVISLVHAGNRVSGWFQSSAYGFENAAEDQQWDLYETLHLQLTPFAQSNFKIKTLAQYAKRGEPAEWNEKVYNLYADWKLPKTGLKLRVGRQFLFSGVINGTLDAVRLDKKLGDKLTARVVVGTVPGYERKLKVKEWDAGNAIGGYLTYYTPLLNRLELSYFQKARSGETYWQQLGSTLGGDLLSGMLHYYLRFDYNLKSKEYQTLRARLNYYLPRWGFSAEFTSRRPQIYEDSFFNIFDIKPYNQIRTAATYFMGKYELSLQYLFTVYETHDFYILYKDDNDSRIIGSISTPYGVFGLIYQTGMGGDNVGYYAQLQYEVLEGLKAKLYNSYYNYERAYTNISEDALSFSAGLEYRVLRNLDLAGEVQQSSNTYYKNDWRGLFRLTYHFRY
ncbi:MAG: hypothetical protein Kow0037_28150 [Calditrichia bacterium]